MSQPRKTNHHLKDYSYGTRICQIPEILVGQRALTNSLFHAESCLGNTVFEGYILLFTPLLLESQAVRARSILRNHLVHPLVLQRRRMFTCEKIAR